MDWLSLVEVATSLMASVMLVKTLIFSSIKPPIFLFLSTIAFRNNQPKLKKVIVSCNRCQ